MAWVREKDEKETARRLHVPSGRSVKGEVSSEGLYLINFLAKVFDIVCELRLV